MVQPTPRPAAIVAVTGDDDRHVAVVKRAATVAKAAGSTVILWDRDASGSPLESPLPTEWSGDGEEEQFGDRLAPRDLEAAGQAPLAKQVGALRADGLDAWGWLPNQADAEHLAQYASDHNADLVLVSADDDDLIADLRDLRRHAGPGASSRLRVETVPR
jgi:hypothetical protein